MLKDEPSTETLRILDANFNRALEGLRVVEDYLRFARDDHHLTESCKKIRHELVNQLQCISADRLHRSRNTIQDVGVDISTAEEFQRRDIRSVASASLKRVEQSFRCLEEYLKVNYPRTAQHIEQLRYRVYTLEKSVSVCERAKERLQDAYLQILIDGRKSLADFTSLAESLVNAGANILQLRAKQLHDQELLQRGNILREMCNGSDTLFIMNDRPDLAHLVQADGVHLGQNDLPVDAVRRIVGADTLVGVSTHDLEQARQAVDAGADYIGVGPVFASRTKAFDQFPGLALLHEVSREIRLPAFAIGGIARSNLNQVTAAGFARIAVSGAVLLANDPAAEVRHFMDIFANVSSPLH